MKRTMTTLLVRTTWISGYQISGMERVPISGPRSNYDVEDIVNQSTDHDIRLRQSVLDLKVAAVPDV